MLSVRRLLYRRQSQVLIVRILLLPTISLLRWPIRLSICALSICRLLILLDRLCLDHRLLFHIHIYLEDMRFNPQPAWSLMLLPLQLRIVRVEVERSFHFQV